MKAQRNDRSGWAIAAALSLFALLILLPVRTPAVAAQYRIIYVDANAGDNTNDGQTPETAFATIQYAINDCNDGDTVIIAPGTYTGEGNRDIDFLGKAITVRSSDPNDATIVAATVIDCNGTTSDPHRAFVFAGDENGNTVLDGLAITNGQMPTTPSKPEETCGGAVACFSASPTIRNCIVGNSHALLGGGIFLMRSNARIVNCQFTKNTATSGGALCGQEVDVSVYDCTFVGNESINGGALSLTGSRACVDHCTFTANTAERWGGALGLSHSDVDVTNCLLTGNSASDGSAIMCEPGPVTVLNCTITDNTAHDGSAILFHDLPIPHGGASGPGPGVSVLNSIIWNNPSRTGEQKPSPYGAAPNLSCVEDLDVQPVGIGNTEADPCFVEPGYWDPNGTPEDANDDFWIDGDYHLKSQAGRWDPATASWARDDVTSPCIDAGDPMTPIGPEPFPNGGVVNMGAYGGTAEASKPWFAQPLCETIVAGDINGDCIVDFKDMAFITMHWLEDRQSGENAAPDGP